jgi:UPF0176 protein
MQLYNTLSADERAIMIDHAGKRRLTLSFYAYAHILDPTKFRNELFLAWNKLDVLGRIYVASEGINAQLSLPADCFYAFKETLENYRFMTNMRINIAVEQDDFSFLKLTIKVRDKIVADGLEDETLDVTNIGIHLKAAAFNTLLDDPNTIVVDMRNHYESEIGHFTNAIKPDVDTFRESLPIIEEQLAAHKEDKNLLMYCTGGIRCEKASAYFKHKGFKNVYQLEGGIIEYTRQIKEEGLDSKFIGKNFVFDQRLGERITNDVVSNCHQCGNPCDVHTNCANDGCHLLFIQCESCKDLLDNCCSYECQEVTHLPLDEQVKLRQGIKNGNKIFKKGKAEALIFKKPSEVKVFSTGKTLAKAEVKKVVKTYVGKAQHYYTKSGIGEFLIEENSITVGDNLLIKGPTTGEEFFVLESMFILKAEAETAKVGDRVSFKLPFRIRLSDILYKIEN